MPSAFMYTTFLKYENCRDAEWFVVSWRQESGGGVNAKKELERMTFRDEAALYFDDGGGYMNLCIETHTCRFKRL